jgi:hypothetical protein
VDVSGHQLILTYYCVRLANNIESVKCDYKMTVGILSNDSFLLRDVNDIECRYRMVVAIGILWVEVNSFQL